MPALADSQLVLMCRSARWRRRVSAAAFATVVASEAVALGVLAWALIAAVGSMPYYFATRGKLEQLPLSDRLVEGFGLAMAQAVFMLPPIVYAGLYLVPFILTLPITAAVIGLWTEPPRFVFLRPFHDPASSRALIRIARRAGSFGHCYTLSDRHVRIPAYIRIPFLLGQVSLLSFRLRRIKTGAQVERLAAAVRRTWLRNTNWCTSWSKLFPVASADAVWESCVRALLRAADVVIVDVTELRPNIVRELELCRELGRASAVLYLVERDRRAVVEREFEARVGISLKDDEVFPYESAGRPDSARLDAAIASALIRSGSRPKGAPPRVAAVAVIAFALAVLPMLWLPILLGERFGPELYDGAWPGWTRVLTPATTVLLAAAWTTLGLLLYAARSNRSVRPLAAVQAVLTLLPAVQLIMFRLCIGVCWTR